MTLKTRDEIESMMHNEAAYTNGACWDVAYHFDTRDADPTEDQKRAAWDHSYDLFPEGGYGALAAFADYIAHTKGN